MSSTALARIEQSIARITARDHALRACVRVRAEARDEAALIDQRSESARETPLAGWTVAVKDNTDVAGTVRSDGLGPPHPPPATVDATSVARLRRAGAVILAKANLEQLSFGATTQNDHWGACRNPWDLTRIPGGSSGGSAVAVAAGLVDVALGTDTGGSLRNPASFCGVSALRPTHGLVPVDGVTPLSPSMDVVGPIARTVAELRLVLGVLAGCAPDPEPAADLTGLRVGVPSDYFFDALDGRVAAGLEELIALLRTHGAVLRPVMLSGVPGAAEAAAVQLNAEAALSLRAWWDDQRISPGIRERIELGRAATGGDRARAASVGAMWRDAVAAAFAGVDVILIPATPFPAPAIETRNLVTLSRAINRCNGVWSLIGVPSLVIPVAATAEGLPVGAQLIAPAGGDARLLAIGEAIQSHSDWHLHTAPDPSATRV